MFGQVALSCHMAMDLFCQEMRDAFWVGSESLDSTPCAVITVPVKFSCGTVTATKPYCCDKKGAGCGERREK